ncbi:MAG: adenylate/guanylate cyclase domain-containing protein [Bacteroidetes bacterium]|nr:adenylate/guanylate cyclase domain-containing protein [Bacteroidota bacterium]
MRLPAGRQVQHFHYLSPYNPNLAHTMKRLWNYLVTIGIDEYTPAAETRYISFLNAIVVLVMVLIVQNLGLCFKYRVTGLQTLMFLAHGLVIGIILLWSKLKQFLLGRVWFGVWAPAFLTSYQVTMGSFSRWDVFLVVCVFLNFFMFPVWQRKWMWLCVAYASACFFGVALVAHVPPYGVLHLPMPFIAIETSGNLAGFLFCGIAMGAVAFVVINRAERSLSIERDRSERLLTNILPGPIAERLKHSPATIADDFEETTILFADIAGFTKYTETVAPTQLITLLNAIFTEFDDLSDKYQAEKIKTIGDAYMVVSGVPVACGDHAERMADMALDMLQAVERYNREAGQAFQIRVGIHSGPVIAGVIGKKKFAYDLWGDSVNTAARMESHGIPGEIQVSETTWALLKGKYRFEERGMVEVKGKGMMRVFLLKGK